MLLPETPEQLAEETNTDGSDAGISPKKDSRLTMAADDSNNLLDAISRGTTDGLKLAVNVGLPIYWRFASLP